MRTRGVQVHTRNALQALAKRPKPTTAKDPHISRVADRQNDVADLAQDLVTGGADLVRETAGRLADLVRANARRTERSARKSETGAGRDFRPSRRTTWHVSVHSLFLASMEGNHVHFVDESFFFCLHQNIERLGCVQCAVSWKPGGRRNAIGCFSTANFFPRLLFCQTRV